MKRILLACLVMFCLPSSAPLFAQKITENDLEFPPVEAWIVLRDDARLRKRVNVDFKDAKIGDIVAFLQNETGVSLVMSPAEASQPFARLLGKGPRAWEVMREIVINSDIQGRWEKEADGYRLHFHNVTDLGPKPPEGSSWATFWLLLVLVGVAVGVITIIGVRIRRRKKTPDGHPAFKPDGPQQTNPVRRPETKKQRLHP